jgi:hypothetical protein
VSFVGPVAKWSLLTLGKPVTHDMIFLSREGPFLGPEARLIDKVLEVAHMSQKFSALKM